TRIAAAICILLALTVPPLELVPFATTAPMGAIAAFGLALFVRDGLLMIIAAALSGGAIAVGVAVINGSGGCATRGARRARRSTRNERRCIPATAPRRLLLRPARGPVPHRRRCCTPTVRRALPLPRLHSQVPASSCTS